jgi:hypothetical protein
LPQVASSQQVALAAQQLESALQVLASLQQLASALQHVPPDAQHLASALQQAAALAFVSAGDCGVAVAYTNPLSPSMRVIAIVLMVFMSVSPV